MHVDPASVLPVIGTKEFIAWLPVMLGLGPADTVIYPSLAYPTYDIGARLAGAASAAVSDVTRGVLDGTPDSAWLLWVNSPSNPTGRVLPPESLREAVTWARAHPTASRRAGAVSTRPVGLDGELSQSSRDDCGASDGSSAATEAAPASRAPMS